MISTIKKSLGLQLCVLDTLVYKYLQVARKEGDRRHVLIGGVEASKSGGGGLRGEDVHDGLHERLMIRLLTLLPGRALAFEAGLNLQPDVLGDLGPVVASSPTLGDALMQCQRFWHIYGSGFSIGMRNTEGQCCITVDVLPHVHRSVRRCAIECLLAAIHQSVVRLSGAKVDVEMLFDGSEPIYASDMRRHVGSIRYGAERCEYRFPSALLGLPSPCGNAEVYRAGLEACLREERGRRAGEATVAYFVSKQLALSNGGYPSFAKIAEKAAMSQRTLRRRLREEGAPFSQLLSNARYADACRLLEQDGLEIGEIAARLGYRERASFTRAFCKWHGVCPREYRDALKQSVLAANW